jgi:26S proteasome regulatory subunit N2
MLKGTIVQQQVYALKKLDQLVDYQWHEIADYLPQIESLVDEEKFPERKLAASVASKVFYQLEAYEDSLRLAMEAGERFNINLDN